MDGAIHYIVMLSSLVHEYLFHFGIFDFTFDTASCYVSTTSTPNSTMQA